MATLPRQAIDAYTERLNSLSRAARETVAAMLSQVEYQGIADLREQVIEAMEAVCGASSDAAAALAADFYDEVREAQTGAALGAEAAAMRSPEATAKAVRALVQIVVDGRPWERFVSQLQDRADYEVKRSAGECVKANAARDPLRPKWARVPSGAETCGFCLMLASRGFAYASERSASEKAEGGHYHSNCDCRVVVSFNGSDIEGYDPDELYRQWKDSGGPEAMQRHEERKQERDATEKEGGEPVDKVRAYWVAEGRKSYDIPREKIAGYCLKDEGKARAFLDALGYTADDADLLADELYRAAAVHPPTYRNSDEWGDRYTGDFVIPGRNGKKAKVRTGWIIDKGGGKMRLVTAYVDK